MKQMLWKLKKSHKRHEEETRPTPATTITLSEDVPQQPKIRKRAVRKLQKLETTNALLIEPSPKYHHVVGNHSRTHRSSIAVPSMVSNSLEDNPSPSLIESVNEWISTAAIKCVVHPSSHNAKGAFITNERVIQRKSSQRKFSKRPTECTFPRINSCRKKNSNTIVGKENSGLFTKGSLLDMQLYSNCEEIVVPTEYNLSKPDQPNNVDVNYRFNIPTTSINRTKSQFSNQLLEGNSVVKLPKHSTNLGVKDMSLNQKAKSLARSKSNIFELGSYYNYQYSVEDVDSVASKIKRSNSYAARKLNAPPIRRSKTIIESPRHYNAQEYEGIISNRVMVSTSNVSTTLVDLNLNQCFTKGSLLDQMASEEIIGKTTLGRRSHVLSIQNMSEKFQRSDLEDQIPLSELKHTLHRQLSARRKSKSCLDLDEDIPLSELQFTMNML